MNLPIQRWESRVIHLNVNPSPQRQSKQKPSPGGSGEVPPAEQAKQQQPNQIQQQKPIFSESYLKHEFPDHYPQGPATDQPAAPQHPATQLQNFINKFGQEGWEFMGINTIGQLVLMFFRRPLPADANQHFLSSAAASTQPTSLQQPKAQAAVAQPTPESSNTQHQEAVLEQILQRLEALEENKPVDSNPGRPMNPAEILSPEQQAQLPDTPLLPTGGAAEALGLRSAGGLLSYGSRHNYPIGLVKRTNTGMVAVYLGTEQRPSGGKPIRLWKVFPLSALPQ